MQQVWWLADTHFGHGDNILRFRPQFQSALEHDLTIVSNINTVVKPNDTLVLAGDILIRSSGLWCLEALHCKNIILVPGNHDGERCDIPEFIFKRITATHVTKIDNTVAVTTHIPIHPSTLTRWKINIHGHLHDDVIDDPRYINVSCEQTGYQPVNKAWINTRFKRI